MNLITLLQQNLFSPSIIFFVEGVFLGRAKCNFVFPKIVSKCLASYLMVSIGFKGGVALLNYHNSSHNFIIACIAGLIISLLQPFLSYFILKTTTKLDNATAAAVAGHYGSVSIITFTTAVAFLDNQAVAYEGYIVAILAIMESPAIFSSLFIAFVTSQQIKRNKLQIMVSTIVTILPLLAAILIGVTFGNNLGIYANPVLVQPFQIILCVFMLDMGLVVSKNILHLHNFNLPLISFGIYMPLIGSMIGVFTSYVIGLDVGTGTLFSMLCASASYIAVPAVMRLALPEAKVAIYLPMSLVITFPFNIICGIPLYYEIAQVVLA